jgi:hypothetical protein
MILQFNYFFLVGGREQTKKANTEHEDVAIKRRKGIAKNETKKTDC